LIKIIKQFSISKDYSQPCWLCGRCTGPWNSSSWSGTFPLRCLFDN